MIVAEVAKSKNDEFYTPSYTIKPILKYIEPNSVIWCPFDTKDSLYVKEFENAGHWVIYSHISEGKDFFKMKPPKCDYIISNPPFSSIYIYAIKCYLNKLYLKRFISKERRCYNGKNK